MNVANYIVKKNLFFFRSGKRMFINFFIFKKNIIFVPSIKLIKKKNYE